MNIYEMFGRQAEQMQELCGFFASTMQLLQQIRNGEVIPCQIVLNQTGWEVEDQPKQEESDGDKAKEAAGSNGVHA